MFWFVIAANIGMYNIKTKLTTNCIQLYQYSNNCDFIIIINIQNMINNSNSLLLYSNLW